MAWCATVPSAHLKLLNTKYLNRYEVVTSYLSVIIYLDLHPGLNNYKRMSKLIPLSGDWPIQNFNKIDPTCPPPTVELEFLQNWLIYYDPPKSILSHNGSQSVAHLLIEGFHIIGSKIFFKTTYHAQCNGKFDISNKTIFSALGKYLGDHPPNWILFKMT